MGEMGINVTLSHRESSMARTKETMNQFKLAEVLGAQRGDFSEKVVRRVRPDLGGK